MTELQNHLHASTGEIATVTGRYYAMDRDKRWERVKLAYDGMVNASGVVSTDILGEVKKSYEQDITDEFIKPIINGKIADTKIKEGDVVISFNLRTER